jgi:hypothetical protein
MYIQYRYIIYISKTFKDIIIIIIMQLIKNAHRSSPPEILF